jgi:TolB-like protein
MLVKPFRYLGIDPARAYLADAITDDLTAELGHIPLSRIMARDTAVAVRDQTPDQIGRALACATSWRAAWCCRRALSGSMPV